MKKLPFIILLAVMAVSMDPANRACAQLVSTDTYEIGIAPDIWFNTVDGIIVGARFRGEDPRTFLDGPHRLHAGIWLGTRLPAMPVSYSLAYTHPVAVISGINSEGAIGALSSVRTGLHLHEAGIQKRWQPGFDEFVSTDLRIFAGFYKRFDDSYLLYKQLWQDDPVVFLNTHIRKRDRNRFGRWMVSKSVVAGVPVTTESEFLDYSGQLSERPDPLGLDGFFGQVSMEWMQIIGSETGFYARTRLFGGISSNGVPREHRYLQSDAQAFNWHGSPLTRARGTIPVNWMRSGWIHIPGGPGMRGYTFRTSNLLEKGLHPWTQHAVSLNMDLYFPNPVNRFFTRIPYLGDVLRLESYLFADAGYMYELSDWQDLRLNAGGGLLWSLNIPDYLGQNRGFFIRYEIPFWLSDAGNEGDNFQVRHLLGLGMLFRM